MSTDARIVRYALRHIGELLNYCMLDGKITQISKKLSTVVRMLCVTIVSLPEMDFLGGMVQQNLPPVRAFTPDQAEDAIVLGGSSLGRAVEMKFPRHHGIFRHSSSGRQ